MPISLREEAFNGTARIYEITNADRDGDLEEFLWSVYEDIRDVFLPLMEEYSIRGRLIANVEFVKLKSDSDQIFQSFYIPSLAADFIHNFDEWFLRHMKALNRNLENFNQKSSNWIFNRVLSVDIKLSLIDNLHGGEKFNLPASLKLNSGIVNVNAPERMCFLYAVLSILCYNNVKHNRQSPYSYSKYLQLLKTEGISFPMKFSDIPKFEKLNDVKVNVHVWSKKLLGIRYCDNKFVGKYTVNLLLVCNKGRNHYCGITKLSALYYKANRSNSRFYCERCVRKYWSKSMLEKHYQFCSQGKAQIEVMPSKKDYHFQSFEKELSPLLVCYADFESIIEKDTKAHKPIAASCYSVWNPHFRELNKSEKVKTWVGADCVIDFLNYLDSLAKQLYRKIQHMSRNSMTITSKQYKEWQSVSRCPRCFRAFSKDVIKVRDHDHISGQYRGALCSQCNFRLRMTRNQIIIAMHNFRNYDSHHICRRALGRMKNWKINLIPLNREKFMCLEAKLEVDKHWKTKRSIFMRIKFIDSFQFLSTSLAKLVSSLPQFTHVKKLECSDDSIIRSKGVFPYTYLDSENKLTDICLPSKDAFYNDLTKEEISDEDYNEAKRAWLAFNCSTLKDYLLAYLKLDTYLLADVFECFRKTTLKEDEVDPIHYISLPQMSYDIVFKKTNVHIDLLQDPNMYSFFQRGIRGGLAFTNYHHVSSDVSLSRARHLAYIDENGLYAKCLSMTLPQSDFFWLTEDEINFFSKSCNIHSLEHESNTGYIFEVDLEYPVSIHEKTAPFPLAPEHRAVEWEMLSPFMKDMHKSLCFSRKSTSRFNAQQKLLMHQGDRQNYIVHYRVLQFYLSMGMILTKIHSGIKFKQSAWMKDYITSNAERRQKAATDFEKDYYKLLNNAVYGKTMEDVRKRIDYKITTTKEDYEKLAMNPLFVSYDIYEEDCVGVELYKSKITLNKPIYIGQTVLDYSKLIMYELYYETLTNNPLIKKAALCGGDTDSFFLALYSEPHVTLDNIFQSMPDVFDSSNYPQSHPLFSNVNKSKLGCFKDESAGKKISEFILLRPKMYSMKFEDSGIDGIRRAKGVQKSVVKRFNHNDYVKVFENEMENDVTMCQIRSKQHIIRTISQRKRALSLWEDKRYWIDKNFSVPYGYMGEVPIPTPKRHRLLPASGDCT